MTVNNGSCISMDVIEDTIVNEWNYFVLLLFLVNLTVSFDCLTLQDKDNIHIVGKYKKGKICTRCKIGQHLAFYMFLKFVQINYIFSDNVCIIYSNGSTLIVHKLKINDYSIFYLWSVFVVLSFSNLFAFITIDI